MTILYAVLAATLGFGGAEGSTAATPVVAQCQQLAIAAPVPEAPARTTGVFAVQSPVRIVRRTRLLPIVAVEGLPVFARFARFSRRFE